MRLVSATIFKDEYAHLQRMFASVMDKTDGQVLVNTGHHIHPDMLPRVPFTFPWTEHFGDAKNYAVERAEEMGADWIVVIDSDEELIEEEPGALRRACAAAPSYGLGIELRNLAPDGTVNHQAIQWRILQAGQGIRFHGRVHEQLRHPDHETAQLHVAGGCYLLHHGYRDPLLLPGAKRKRNNHLLRLSIRERPDEETLWFQLGAQLLMNGTPKRAVPCLEKAITIWRAKGADPFPVHVRSMHYRLAEAYHRSGQFAETMAIYTATPNEALCAELVFYAGMSSLCLGRTADAEHFLQLVPQLPANETDVTRFGYLIALAGVYETCGQHDRALQTLRQVHALEGQNANPQVLLGLASVHAKLGHIEAARQWAQQILDADMPASWQAKARALTRDLTQNPLAQAAIPA